MNIRLLALETGDLELLKNFYHKILGISLTEEDENSFTLALVQSELQFSKHTGSNNPVYHFACNIPANKIEEARQWLQSKVKLLWLNDYNSEVADFKNWHAKSVYFYDPAGNIVELIARFDLDNATAEPFTAAQILSVSEIGLVFAAGELEAKTKELMDVFQLSYFSKQLPLEHFKAMGDDEGLFIVVPENRAWYPTQDEHAKPAPLKIYFSIGIVDNWLEYDSELQSWSSSIFRFT